MRHCFDSLDEVPGMTLSNRICPREIIFLSILFHTLSHLKNAEQATRNEKEIKALIRHRTSAYAYVEAAMQSEYAHG